jgi:hypothetical protein
MVVVVAVGEVIKPQTVQEVLAVGEQAVVMERLISAVAVEEAILRPKLVLAV